MLTLEVPTSGRVRDGRIQAKSTTKHAGGRPKSCTPRVQEIILEAAGTGAHRSTIAATAGISPRTLNRFLRLGENALEKRDSGEVLTASETEFCQFCLDFRRAEIAVEKQLVEVVLTAAKSNWRAALAFLERRYPKQWGRRRIVHTVPAPRRQPIPKPPYRPDPLTLELIATELRRRALADEWRAKSPETAAHPALEGGSEAVVVVPTALDHAKGANHEPAEGPAKSVPGAARQSLGNV